MSPRNPTLAEIASCVSGYDPDALPVAQAQEFIARLEAYLAQIDAELAEVVHAAREELARRRKEQDAIGWKPATCPASGRCWMAFAPRRRVCGSSPRCAPCCS